MEIRYMPPEVLGPQPMPYATRSTKYSSHEQTGSLSLTSPSTKTSLKVGGVGLCLAVGKRGEHVVDYLVEVSRSLWNFSLPGVQSKIFRKNPLVFLSANIAAPSSLSLMRTLRHSHTNTHARKQGGAAKESGKVSPGDVLIDIDGFSMTKEVSFLDFFSTTSSPLLKLC